MLKCPVLCVNVWLLVLLLYSVCNSGKPAGPRRGCHGHAATDAKGSLADATASHASHRLQVAVQTPGLCSLVGVRIEWRRNPSIKWILFRYNYLPNTLNITNNIYIFTPYCSMMTDCQRRTCTCTAIGTAGEVAERFDAFSYFVDFP